MVRMHLEEGLAGEVQRLIGIINSYELLTRGKKSGLIAYGPSRHLVIRSEDSAFGAKSHISGEYQKSELNNFVEFSRINQNRSEIFRDVTSSDLPYIGLPDFNYDVIEKILLLSGESKEGPHIFIFNPVKGDLLYEKAINGTATLEDFISAAVQITRIQEEGKIHRRKLGLEDVVRSRQAGQPDYFTERFRDVFLGQLLDFSGIQLSPLGQEIMWENWQISIAPPLIKAHYDGFNGYYFDGNPRHHILVSSGGVVSIDFEYKILTPLLLGLASLVSFGLTKDGKTYISHDEQLKILDRVLLEIEFVNALRFGAREKATRIFNYISERYGEGNYDLSEEESDDFFRFIGRNDKGLGIKRREQFLAAWPYALLDRNAAWIGHKARYRAVAEQLSKVKDIKFELLNPLQQYVAEQRQHLGQILDILWQLYESSPTRDHKRRAPLITLYGCFKELQQHPYFNKN